MAKQFLSPGFEREPENNYECLQCSQPITNPLCHGCLGKDICVWLSSYPRLKKKIMPKIRTYVKNVNNLVINSSNCVSCNKRKAALCPYCFTEGVLNLLKRNKVNGQIIEDFLFVFNFDFGHEGYIRDAIKEGLY